MVRTNDLLLNYQSGASEDQIAALVKAVNGVEVKRIPEIHVILVRVPDNMAQPAVAQRALTGGQMSAQASGGIVEKNLTFHAAAPYVPNDPRFSMAFPNGQTQLQDVAPDGVVNAGIYAPLAWGIATTRGSGVTVAVLDTGVNGVGTAGANPDLTPNVLTTGYDFVDDDTSAAEVLGGNYSGHGTHVAGIIAAAANNGKGIAGIAFMAKILPVRVLNPSGNGDTMDVAQGIIYATDHGAKVINMSFVGNSTTYSYTLEAAINYALSKGVVPIAAAGNESKNINTNPVYPASLSTVISVGATDHTLAARWDPTPGAVGSNYGKVDVYAPGESIWSTCLPQASSGLFACNPNDPYVTATGTSMATAEVSGAAALIIGAKVATTPATVREALTCGTLTFPGHPNDPVGVGEIQLDFALNWHQNSNNCKITLPNDDVRTPTNILSVPFSTVVGVDGRNATHATDDPDLSGGNSVCNGVFSSLQTLWYKYKPAASGPYQFSTFGSSYDGTIATSYNTVVSVWKGEPGALISVACNDDYYNNVNSPFPIQSDLTTDLIGGQTYYIMISTQGAIPTNPQVLNFSVRQGILATTKIENIATNFAYTGMWATVSNVGQSATVAETTDDYATVAFSIRSTNFIIAHTTGPAKADIDVYVDGALAQTLGGHAAKVTYQVQDIVTLTNTTLSTHQVVLTKHPGFPGQPLDLDWIQGLTNEPVAMTPIVGQVDDTDKRIIYWPSIGPGPNEWTREGFGLGSGRYNNSDTYANNPAAHVDFKFTGSTVIVYRHTGSTYGTMNVFVDGQLYANVDNVSTADFVSSPYVIGNLSSSEHVVSLYPGSSSTLAFDSAKVVAAADLPIAKSNENVANILYSGKWTPQTLPGTSGAYLNSATMTTDGNATVTFSFTGTQLVVGFAARNSTPATRDGEIDVIVDGLQEITAPTNVTTDPFLLPGGTLYGCKECYASTRVLSNAKHTVQLVWNNQGDTNAAIFLDWVQVINYPTLKSSMGLIPETNTAFLYSTTNGVANSMWKPTAPWARFNGGTAKYVDHNNDGAYITGHRFPDLWGCDFQ